jgi:membrane glycosyltransferase
MRHGIQTLFGVLWAAGIYWLNPAFLWWLLPIVGALIVSIPLSVFSSRASLGRRFRNARLFLIPEESWPPLEIRLTRRYLKHAKAMPNFVDAVVDPLINAIACASAVARPQQAQNIRARQTELEEKALLGGPDALTVSEQSMLLDDPVALSCLHFQVWAVDDAHPSWKSEARMDDSSAVSAKAQPEDEVRARAALPECEPRPQG